MLVDFTNYRLPIPVTLYLGVCAHLLFLTPWMCLRELNLNCKNRMLKHIERYIFTSNSPEIKGESWLSYGSNSISNHYIQFQIELHKFKLCISNSMFEFNDSIWVLTNSSESNSNSVSGVPYWIADQLPLTFSISIILTWQNSSWISSKYDTWPSFWVHVEGQFCQQVGPIVMSHYMFVPLSPLWLLSILNVSHLWVTIIVES